MHVNCLDLVQVWPAVTGRIQRTQRYPQYSDHELEPWFGYVAQGYCFNQAADKCLYPRKWIWNTIYSDDDVAHYALDLSMAAGARIRAREQKPPADRYDGLWDEYLID